jgi:Fur family transcriptional regulator, ferric uptake regulator
MKRDTQQRAAIWNSLVRAGRPLSVHEVFDLARKEISGLGIATVYRNLKDLQSEDKVAQVELPGQPPRWEVTPEEHHHHFLCRNCDRIYEINNCPEDIARLLPEGYTLEEHDILLRGVCRICNKKSNTKISKT